MKILITGGAGFVGSYLAKAFKKKFPNFEIFCFDNLKRRGGELNLPTFKELGIQFIHGDIRNPFDLEDLNTNFDLVIEASAEPSVVSGVNSGRRYLLQTNLEGTLNCLEFIKNRCGSLIFLSTSRVYSINELLQIPLEEGQSRLHLKNNGEIHGLTSQGITEEFNALKARSFYGATKLASEVIIQEYLHCFEMNGFINRCGVICGPGQWGKVDQGAFSLWMAFHYFKKPLRYTGFGGKGKQVRDLLHPEDLFQLLLKQIESFGRTSDTIYNVGGGLDNSSSLLEHTSRCQKLTGHEVPIEPIPEGPPMDVPFYVSDNTKVSEDFNWSPEKSLDDISSDIFNWLKEEEKVVKNIFC